VSEKVKQLFQFENEKKQLEWLIKQEKKKLHKKFIKDHKKLLLFFDIIIIASVLMNIGAVMITNALVPKEVPIEEANPIQAKIHGYATSPEANAIYFKLLLQSAMWVFIISCYLFNRIHVSNKAELFSLILLVVWVGYIITYDFMNDFGFLITNWLA
jgi:hypothetical protein